jgi:tRNA A-37 threonylcarbamoyl transferase component Bud32
MIKFIASPWLREHGLGDFDAVMSVTGGKSVRSVPGRSTVRLHLGDRVVFLKRYEPGYYPLFDRLFHRDEAEHEWTMIHALQRAGFNVPTPVAVGRRGLWSFVMTEEINGGVPADSIKPPLAKIGRLLRQFHDAGFIHKDSYLCHIFVAGDKLYLIDLQRVLGPGKFAERWRVKDLAALAHSAERIGVSVDELLQAYGGDESLMRKVGRRVSWLNQRRPKYVGVWDDPAKNQARF